MLQECVGPLKNKKRMNAGLQPTEWRQKMSKCDRGYILIRGKSRTERNGRNVHGKLRGGNGFSKRRLSDTHQAQAEWFVSSFLLPGWVARYHDTHPTQISVPQFSYMSMFTVIRFHIPTYCHLIQIFILVLVSTTPDKSIKETPQCQVNV